MPYLAGQILTADDLNAWLPVSAVKPGSTSRNTTTTLTADPDLSVALPANTQWDVECLLLVSSAVDAAGDFAYAFSFPANATVSIGAHQLDPALASGTIASLNAGGATSLDTVSPTITDQAGCSTTINAIHVLGRITLGATAGNLAVVWSQINSNANNTTVHGGSFLTARRVP